MTNQNSHLLEALLVLCVVFFCALFYEMKWFLDPTGVSIETMILSVWITAVSGITITALTLWQWKTNKPVRITWAGLGFGLMTLGISAFSAELIVSPLGTGIRMLLWIGLSLLICGFVCVAMQMVTHIRNRRGDSN